MDNEQQATSGGPTPGQVPASSSNKTLIIIIIVVAALALGSYVVRSTFSGERMAERAIEQATGGDVDIDVDAGGEGTIRMTGEDGGEFNYSAGGEVSLPSDWPDEVPIVDGATLMYVGSMDPQTGEPAKMVSFTSDKPASEIASYYEAELASKGWTITGTMNMQGTSMVTATKDEREAVVYIGGDAEATTVNISVSG